MRKKIVAGNWKMNKTLQEGIELAKEVNSKVKSKNAGNVTVIIGAPFIHLTEVNKIVDPEMISVASQNCAAEVSGAYTGEISAAMVASTGCRYTILGHSERRAYYGETSEILVKKVTRALENKLDVIFCVGEVLEERECGQYFEVVKSQLENGIFNLSAEEFAHVVIAYEPVWAIGTGKTASSAQAQEMHSFIRKTVAQKYGQTVADQVSILYGGSCTPQNASELFANPDVDGGLIGGASLKSDDFAALVEIRGQK
ncbi:triose-phosphate isomerase [Odoribacter sp. OttesenSCG-928-J03]|nr:triose-phosphate isomerase [Odoribacter sp. OttesenSCG-928-J03]MDL2283362.1 triose-phosphate isomerase [Odoribacter sp. OttesenSCG-928-G04]